MTRTHNEAGPATVPGLLRRLRRSDAAAFEAHLLRLDATARNARFGGAVGDDALRRHARLSLDGGAAVYGWFEAGVLRGAGELHRGSGVGGLAPAGDGEAAFSVEAGWQNRGIGTRLMRRVIAAAGTHGIGRVVVVCRSSNRMMQELARRFEARLEIVGGETIGRLETPGPTPFTLLRATVGDSFDLAAANVEWQAGLLLASLLDRAA